MATVVIWHPLTFISKIKKHLEDNGLVENKDFIMSIVHYREEGELKGPIGYPYELFSKDAKFTPQQEFRIILNARNEKVQKILVDGHKIIVGSLKDCAVIRKFPYEGAIITVDYSRGFLNMSEWAPMSDMPIDRFRVDPLLTLLAIPFYNATVTLDGREVGGVELFEIVKGVLMYKYRIVPFLYEGMLRMTTFWRLDEIRKKEVQDPYYYLRRPNYNYKAPVLEKLTVWPMPEVVWAENTETES